MLHDTKNLLDSLNSKDIYLSMSHRRTLKKVKILHSVSCFFVISICDIFVNFDSPFLFLNCVFHYCNAIRDAS